MNIENSLSINTGPAKLPAARRYYKKKPKRRSDETSVEKTREYLESYMIFKKMLAVYEYGRAEHERDQYGFYTQSGNGYGADIAETGSAYDIVCIKMRMREIDRFINGLIVEKKSCDLKLFLKYYYLHNKSVEECAELLFVSRSTAYRFKQRSLFLAASQLFPDDKTISGYGEDFDYNNK